MANILEFLRGVLTDPEAQQVYRADPEGFVGRSGFADLTGEDVVEAIAVLRRSLPADVALALTDFEDETRLPAVRPSFEERDLDAALRQLDHAVALVTGATTPVPVEAPAPPAPFWQAATPAPEPIAVEAEPELVEPAPAPEPVVHHEPIAIENELPDAPSVSALATAIDAAATDVRSLLDEYAREVRDQLAAVLGAAERDAAAIRAEAQGELDAARKTLLDARDEAERIRAEADAARAEVDQRRAELRDAERQLRERLSGLDDVFRTVLKDE